MSIESIIKRNLVAAHHRTMETRQSLMGCMSTLKLTPTGESLAKQDQIEEAIETSRVLENQLAALIDIKKKAVQS